MSLFKVALPGFDVHHSKANQEALDRLYPSPKIDTRPNPPHAGTINFTWASTGLTKAAGTLLILDSFAHGYNYIPSALASFSFDNGTTHVSGMAPLQVGDLAIITVDTDDRNFNLKYLSIDIGSTVIPPFTLQVRYYIMAERGYE